MENRWNSPLFYQMSEEEINLCLECSGANEKTYEKNEMIFTTWTKPTYVYVVLSGSVSVCKDYPSGKSTVLTTIDRPGDLFGEVYLFLDQETYDFYTIANKNTTILRIPKQYFYQTCNNSCGHHGILIRNLLNILARKAYFLTQKVNLLSGGTLRQRIARYLIEVSAGNPKITLGMNREELASYLNVARPSLSRELLNMQEDGLIQLKGKEILIIDFESLENCF